MKNLEGVSKIYVFDFDDLKEVKVENGVIVEIKKKRRGTYGHRGKDGGRFYGRETQVLKFD